MASNADNLNAAPWWAKLAAMFGGHNLPLLALLVVLYGLWQLMNTIGMRMATAIEANQTTLIKHAADSADMLTIQSQLVSVVRANCYNNARDEASKERCMK